MKVKGMKKKIIKRVKKVICAKTQRGIYLPYQSIAIRIGAFLDDISLSKWCRRLDYSMPSDNERSNVADPKISSVLSKTSCVP